MFLKSLKFELDQICIQTSFDHNLSFVAPFELILLQIEALDLNFLIRPNPPNFGTVRNCLMWQELIACFRSFPKSFIRFFCVSAYVCNYLLTID